MTSRIEHHDPRKEGSFSLTYHYEMLSDESRVTPFARAIDQLCHGAVVFESGTGSGIMSILAARAGARHVFCTELDPRIAAFARSNIAASGVGDRITLLAKSTTDVTLADIGGEKIDVAMAENLATWLVTEPQNQVMNHLRDTLSHDRTVTIPGRVRNVLELAQARYRFYHAVSLKTHYVEFTGVPRAAIHSKETECFVFDYAQLNPTEIEGEVRIEVVSSGVVNAVRLTSPVELAQGVGFSASDSLMPPVVVPLEQDLTVAPGDTVIVQYRYRTNTAWEQFQCSAKLA